MKCWAAADRRAHRGRKLISSQSLGDFPGADDDAPCIDIGALVLLHLVDIHREKTHTDYAWEVIGSISENSKNSEETGND